MFSNEMRKAASNDIDFDRLLRANLERVFNERDEDKRRTAIAELFVEEPVMYEPTKIVRGRLEISRVARELLKQFGPTFRFVPDGVAVGHHGLARLAWHAGPEQGPIAVTGADVAEVEGGKIARLWVLLNPPQ
ncbi:nuclear transport factor 2 family protein [Bradyrhizobium sp. USDA 372]